MQTYPIMDGGGLFPFAFEIENAYIRPRKVGRLLSRIEGVEAVHVRRPFSKWEDAHVWFQYMNRDYVVMEPFGDNSRYWIGPKDPKNGGLDVREIEKVFQRYQPPLYLRILGDILTLRLFR